MEQPSIRGIVAIARIRSLILAISWRGRVEWSLEGKFPTNYRKTAERSKGKI